MVDEMIGRWFGRLRVTREVESYVAPSGGTHKRYECECKCGNTVTVLKEHLMSGRQKSCGCLRKENGMRTHGEIHTRLYRIWGNMCNRCSNVNNPAWDRYGGRGICVCEEWRRFENFRDWAYSAGYSDELTLDRLDNDKGYNSTNCRWATDVQQANNKRNNRLVEYRGITQTLSEWASELQIPYKTLHRRIVALGWATERAFEYPLRKHSP